MKEFVCKCGGNLEEQNNFWVCDCCRSKYLKDTDDDGHEFYYQPIEKMTVKYGQVATKASNIPTNTIVAKEIKINENAEIEVIKDSLDLSSREMINNVKSYLSEGAFEQAQNMLNKIFEQTQSCAEAYWYVLWCEKKITSKNQINIKFSNFTQADAIRLNKSLENSSPDFAREILDLLFEFTNCGDEACKNILSTIIPFTYDKNVYKEKEQKDKIEKAFTKVIDLSYVLSFEYLLNTLRSDEVDDYINYLMKFAEGKKCSNEYSQKCYRKILEVDEGNNDARRLLICKEIKGNFPSSQMENDFSDLIKYTADVDKEVVYFIEKLNSESTTTANKSNFMMHILGFHSDSPDGLKSHILKYSSLLLKSKLFAIAKNYYYLILSSDKKNADVYWGLCLARIEAIDTKHIVNCKEPIMDCPEFNKYLTLVDESKKKECINIGKKQMQLKNYKKQFAKIGVIVLAIIALFVVGKGIFNSIKYSEKNIEINIVGKDYNKLSVEIENSGIQDVTYIEGIIKAYDSEAGVLIVNNCNFRGDFVVNKKLNFSLGIEGSDDEFYVFCNYPLDTLKITFQLTSVRYKDYSTKEYPKTKERVVKSINQKAVKEEFQKHRTKVKDLITMLDSNDITFNNLESTCDKVNSMEYASYIYISRNKDLSEQLYKKGKEYISEEEYLKAYVVLDFLACYDYKDSKALSNDSYNKYFENQR